MEEAFSGRLAADDDWDEEVAATEVRVDEEFSATVTSATAAAKEDLGFCPCNDKSAGWLVEGDDNAADSDDDDGIEVDGMDDAKCDSAAVTSRRCCCCCCNCCAFIGRPG